MRVSAVAFFAAIITMGCQKQVVKEKPYVDFDSLINVQLAFLKTSNASLKKQAAIGDQTSSSSTVPDSTAWSHELDVFRQLDLINRPIYQNAYTIKDGVKDSKSNLLIKSFEDPADSAVPYLRLYYRDTPLRLKKLEALYQETNSLYGSQRKLEMYFDDTKGSSYLKGYLIEGDQKMILSDSVHYSIRSEIVFQ
jgi:hypothetical protein